MQTTIRLIKEPFKALYGNFEDFIYLIAGWIALAFILLSISIGLESLDISSKGATFFNVAYWAVLFFACISIEVGWSRLLLLNDRPASTYPLFGHREIVYLKTQVKMFALSLTLFIPAILLAILIPSESNPLEESEVLINSNIFIISLAVVILATSPILMRISLIFPAIAVDEPLTIKESWRIGRGLGVAMAVAIFVVIFLVTTVEFILSAILTALLIVLTLIAPEAIVNNLPDSESFIIIFLKPIVQILEISLYATVIIGGYAIMRERIGESRSDMAS